MEQLNPEYFFNKYFVPGMVFETAADDGGFICECDISHYVFQTVDLS